MLAAEVRVSRCAAKPPDPALARYHATSPVAAHRLSETTPQSPGSSPGFLTPPSVSAANPLFSANQQTIPRKRHNNMRLHPLLPPLLPLRNDRTNPPLALPAVERRLNLRQLDIAGDVVGRARRRWATAEVVGAPATGCAAWLPGGSRMSGEVRVRFRASLGVRLPGAAHLVILGRGHAAAAPDRVRATLERLGLTLNEQKTGIRDAWPTLIRGDIAHAPE